MGMARSPEARRPGRWLALVLAAACAVRRFSWLVLSLAGPWTFPRLLARRTSLSGRWQGARSAATAASWPASVASLLLSAAVALAATLPGFVTARAVSVHPRRRLLLFLACLPFVLSPAILATCLLYVYLRLHLAGTWLGVGLSQLILAYGFAVVFFQGFWNDEMRALGDLVATLGGSPLPGLPAGLLAARPRACWQIAFFQTFLLSYFQYGATVLIGSGQVKTLPLAVYHFVGEANPGYAAVAGCLLVLPPFLLLLAESARHLLRPPIRQVLGPDVPRSPPDLAKKYRPRAAASPGLSFSLERKRTTLGVLGRSGSGKTTLLQDSGRARSRPTPARSRLAGEAVGARAGARAGHRLPLPGAAAVPAPDGVRKRRLRAAPARGRGGRLAPAGGGDARTAGPCRKSAPKRRRTSSPAASGQRVSFGRALVVRARGSCCSTSPSPASTRKPGPTCRCCSKRWRRPARSPRFS